jgi:two-component system sensor histidine kinase and response regulator WspE
MSGNDLSNLSLVELFRAEAETQLATITAGLLSLERNPATPDHLESLMRAAHSIKGAARIVNLGAAVEVAHAMEDCFVAAQKGRLVLTRGPVDVLLAAVDLLARIAQTPEAEVGRWEAADRPVVTAQVVALSRVLEPPPASGPSQPTPPAHAGESPSCSTPFPPSGSPAAEVAPAKPPRGTTEGQPRSEAATAAPGGARREGGDRVLRVKAEHVNRLLGLAGESLVESRWLRPFGDSMLRLKQLHLGIGRSLDALRDSGAGPLSHDRVEAAVADARMALAQCHQLLAERCTELDMFDRRSTNLAHRLYQEALACRMRPFADGVGAFPRMVRDVALALGKEARLEVAGESTQVDRDILERLEAPLTHLVRNAIDHGLETPDERERAGKPREGVVRLEARHSAGRLLITVSEDGRGIEIERVRRTVVLRGLTTEDVAARLSESELLEFLFLPGFTVREQVTEISGRGVGLDVVHSVVKSVRGTIRVQTDPGHGTRFQMQLPLTLSVLRSLLVEVDQEPFAFPLAHVLRTLRVDRAALRSLEGRQHFTVEGRPVGLITARQVLGRPEAPPDRSALSVILLGDSNHRYGLVVDRFLGEKELVVQTLDPRLGKVADISAGAVLEDGQPVLIVDVEDALRSIEKLSGEGTLLRVSTRAAPGGEPQASRKRVLVVDDSLTVRELERKLLAARGYEVEMAVDGMEGWNRVRSGQYHLLISDVDMPRMDGIELVSLVKKDPRLRSLPALIVSYKDREEDRRRGLEAGADYYLTKGSFHDDTFLRAVEDLIGGPQP